MVDRNSRRSCREQGSLIVLILILMVPLAAIGIALVSQGSRQVVEQDSARGRTRALINAESGVDHALAQLLDDPTNLAPIVEQYADSPDLRYVVDLANLGNDGADNDADGLLDESDEEQLVRITSAGSVNVTGYDENGAPLAGRTRHYVKRIRAVGRAAADLPGFPYAVYLGDPLAETDFNGNAFLIDGYDHDTGGNTVAGDAVPGIACTGDPTYIADQVTNQQEDNIIGSGGIPSISATGPLDLQAIIDQYKSSADIVFLNPTHTYTGSLGNPDAGIYEVTYATGNLDISGGCTGAGLLLVEGNLEITGAFEYLGIVIVTGQVIFRGGGGVKRVIGTVLVGGDIIEGIHGEEDLEISGTIDILYSSEVQQNVADAVAAFTIMSWQEM